MRKSVTEVDTGVRAHVKRKLVPLGLKGLPGGKRLVFHGAEFEVLFQIQKGRPTPNTQYRDAVFSYFNRGVREYSEPVYQYNLTYANVLDNPAGNGEELYNISTAEETELLLQDFDRLAVPFFEQHMSWVSIFEDLLTGGAPTIHSLFLNPSRPSILKGAATVAIAARSLPLLDRCYRELQSFDWRTEDGEAARMFIDDIDNELLRSGLQ